LASWLCGSSRPRLDQSVSRERNLSYRFYTIFIDGI
jgi:hypothetical protein